MTTIQEGDMTMRTRVFTITIISMDIAATVASIISLSLENVLNPLVLQTGALLHGFIYFPSQVIPLPSGQKQPVLRTLSNLCTKKLDTVETGNPRRNILSKKNC
jgi:hypothetical protein